MWSLTWDCSYGRIRWDRFLSDPVVVRLGGQQLVRWGSAWSASDGTWSGRSALPLRVP